MSHLPPMVNLQAFEAVARRRSFALAAAELHVTASAISHQVARLESQLGVRLLERSAHGVRLTAAGEQYLARIAGALQAIASASDDLRQGVANSLYVHCSPSIATLWLMPRLAAFAQANPGIALNLSAAHVHSDFTQGTVDLDIRYGVPNWPDLVVEPLFEERIVPLASPAFLRTHRLRRIDQLLDVPLIQSNVNVVQWSDWFQAYSDKRPPERLSLRFDRAQMAMEAAIQGLGVALESAMLAAGHIREGKLRPVFGLDKSLGVKAHFAVYPARHGKRPAVEAFLAWVHAEAARAQLAFG
ncbi:LysR substrate-binding domain-containing protein [Aquabacterium sp. OR-4]|uniref:LysR substrate-binding domain-containing protein n=1 Tax=Aquabacterium sp. OR-4 TaxID=2978127 RepID=UPI0028C8549E|nr:LysR substrate-binding domain-containing protein [Aquabacterium sp. OR-4]MDT7838848.1 LysR substrate-binding domain-containing protein [Aquabacterium sp. OR-4]